ncbi:MAG: ABC transporter substrate-binding protein, partial [Deltaproteobacteria bacterium]|nr:ABC transporter substrate-binding protein [Deltaproteobacteria bacterium]
DVASLPRVTSSILDHGLSPAQIDAAVSAASLDRRPLYMVDGALLAQLRPDLIVTQGVCAVCAVTESTVRQSLQWAPVHEVSSARVLSLEGIDWSGIRHDLAALASAAGQPGRAEALVATLDRRWARLDDARPSSPPTVAMLEWPDPPWFGGHWVPQQVAVAGGRDLFGQAGRPSGRLSWEQLREADPDYVIGIACGFDLSRNRTHLSAAVTGPLAGLRAVAEGRVWAADANALFSRPGPRVVDGAEVLQQIFTGRPVSPQQAVVLG